MEIIGWFVCVLVWYGMLCFADDLLGDESEDYWMV